MIPAERLLLARESISEAKLLQGEKIGNKVVFTKLYHALMYCLFALFDVRIIGNLTHSDVIERFGREYDQQGIFEAGLFECYSPRLRSYARVRLRAHARADG